MWSQMGTTADRKHPVLLIAERIVRITIEASIGGMVLHGAHGQHALWLKS